MDNVKNNSSYKFSEIILSLVLLVSAGVSFSISVPYLYGSALNMEGVSGIKMRGGPPRQHIQMGVPNIWLKNVTEELGKKGLAVHVAKRGPKVWFINASLDNSLNESDLRGLKIFLERYGVELKNNSEIHVKLTGF